MRVIVDSREQAPFPFRGPRYEGVTVEVGEVSAVIPEYLADCWGWARQKRTLLQGCQLMVETLPAVTHCGGCEED